MAVITTISDRLKMLRKKRGVTQAELAERISASRESVAKWESKREIVPKTEDVIALADYYGVSCDYILRGIAPERVAVVQELGLSDMAIQGMQNYCKSTYKSYGLVSELFDSHYGAIYHILDCIEKAIDTRIMQGIEQKRLDEADDPNEPAIQIGNGAEIEYDVVIRALIREASDAFMQNAYTYVGEEAERYAAKENHP